MKILWFSRHKMTAMQEADLRKIYGSKVEIKQVAATATSWKDVSAAGEDCDVLAVVLPPQILGELVNARNNTKPVIRAVANRVPTGGTVLNPATGAQEIEYRFDHIAWEQVDKIEVVTHRLVPPDRLVCRAQMGVCDTCTWADHCQVYLGTGTDTPVVRHGAVVSYAAPTDPNFDEEGRRIG